MSELPALLARLVQGEWLAIADRELGAQLTALGAVKDDAGRFGWPSWVVPLDEARVRSALGASVGPWLRSLSILPSVDSTNALLKAEAACGAIDGVVITAECQLGGRGRLGRSWLSPLGSSLAVSIGIRLARSPADLGGVSLVVGLALLDALDSEGKLGLRLKWPNDVLGPSGKLAGILVEVAATEPRAVELVIGIGVNLALPSSAAEVVGQPVQNLHELLPDAPDRSAVLAQIVTEVVRFCRRFESDGFAPFVPAFDRSHALRGERCRVTGGDEELIGEVLGVDTTGRLLMQCAGETKALMSGELSIRRTDAAT